MSKEAASLKFLEILKKYGKLQNAPREEIEEAKKLYPKNPLLASLKAKSLYIKKYLGANK
jgi:hypothetical protein